MMVMSKVNSLQLKFQHNTKNNNTLISSELKISKNLKA